MEVDYLKLGERLKKERKRKAMTQEVLAERVSVSVKHIGSIERAESIPSIQVLVDLANELNVTTDYLLFDSMKKKQTVYEIQIFTLIHNRSEKFLRHLLKYVQLICDEDV